jgi:hypothetical protein
VRDIDLVAGSSGGWESQYGEVEPEKGDFVIRKEPGRQKSSTGIKSMWLRRQLAQRPNRQRIRLLASHKG